MKTLRIRYAIQLWNRLTSPSTLRSEEEHGRCRRAARRVSRWIERHARFGTDYRELSNGALWPLI